jgi:hypothetical protein
LSEEKVITEEEAHINPMLGMVVQPESELKEYLIEYVGTKFNNEEVTVNMIAEALAEEFPEFTMAFAEENFLRGYQLGLDDATRIPKAES